MATLRDALNIGARNDLYNWVATDEVMALVGGISAYADALVEYWYYSSSSSATDNGTTVIKPASVMGNGRWLRLPDPIPSGTISMYSGTSAPTGYLMCDGAAISRTTYASLFAVVSTTYGAGDGSTTFNLPDLRQRFPIGVAASGTGSILGGTGGAIDHLHAVDPPNTTSTASTNINNVTLLALGSASSPSHTHDVNIPQFDSGTANPPFIALNFIIKY